jgi:thiol-disulfide isomerase/thioredoxin
MRLFWSFVLAAISTTVFAASPVFVDDYEKAISNKDRNVLVILGTDWCSHCVKLKREVNSLNLDDYVVCVVDAEERKDIKKQHSVSSYPTSLILVNGKEVSRKSGYDKKSYEGWLESNRKAPTKESFDHKSGCDCKNKTCDCDCTGDCECGFFCWCGCAWSKLFGG